MANNDSIGAFAIGFVLGGAIGALAGLLLAPKAGVETRAELLEKGEAWRTRADELAADMRARGLDEFNRMNERVGPAVDSLRERGSTATTAVREAGAEVVASAGERVGPVVDAARERSATAATAVRSRIGGNGSATDAEEEEAQKS